MALTKMNRFIFANLSNLNPVKHPWNLVQYPEDYLYSYAKYYESDVDEIILLIHHND